MGLFDRFKGKGNDFQTACKIMGTEFLELYLNETNSLFENITELERQILAIYFFGMVDYKCFEWCFSIFERTVRSIF